MSSSQNETGTYIGEKEVSTSAPKRTTRSSQGLIPKTVSPVNDAPRTPKRQKPRPHWDPTFYGRFSKTDRQERLLPGSPKSEQRLKEVGIDLTLDALIEDMATLDLSPSAPQSDGTSTPPPRQIVDVLIVQFNEGHPIRVKMERLPPSPDDRTQCSHPRKPSPGTVRRAEKIPAPEKGEKVCEATITQEDLEKGRQKPRYTPYQEFNDVSAQTLNTLYGDPAHKTIRKERLHGIDHACNGDSKRANLFDGSWAANSQMMLYDDPKKEMLEERLCKSIHATARAKLQKKADDSEFTHLATMIELTYETDTGLIVRSAPINANSIERPSIKERKIIKDFLIECQKISANMALKSSNTASEKEIELGDCSEHRERQRKFDSFIQEQNENIPPNVPAPTPPTEQKKKRPKLDTLSQKEPEEIRPDENHERQRNFATFVQGQNENMSPKGLLPQPPAEPDKKQPRLEELPQKESDKIEAGSSSEHRERQKNFATFVQGQNENMSPKGLLPQPPAEPDKEQPKLEVPPQKESDEIEVGNSSEHRERQRNFTTFVEGQNENMPPNAPPPPPPAEQGKKKRQKKLEMPPQEGLDENALSNPMSPACFASGKQPEALPECAFFSHKMPAQGSASKVVLKSLSYGFL